MTDPITPPPSPDDVRGVLAGVLDPELHASIVDLGMVHDVEVGPDGDVIVKVALTTAACPLRGQIGNDVQLEGRRPARASARSTSSTTR